jgi:hypothetical protein
MSGDGRTNCVVSFVLIEIVVSLNLALRPVGFSLSVVAAKISVSITWAE